MTSAGADGGQIAAAVKDGGALGNIGHRKGHLQGHAHPCQTLEGVGTVGMVGVHHRHGGGQDLLAGVVVGDDHLDALFSGIGHLVHGGDAAVHRDDEGDPLGGEVVDGLVVEAVALLQPVGDVGQDSAPFGAEELRQQTGGGDAVHVVVAVDRHEFFILNCPADARHRLVHVPQEHGVVGDAAVGIEQSPGLFPGGNAPGGEDPGQQGGDSGPEQGLLPRGTGGRDVPLFIFHCRPLLSRKWQ